MHNQPSCFKTNDVAHQTSCQHSPFACHPMPQEQVHHCPSNLLFSTRPNATFTQWKRSTQPAAYSSDLTAPEFLQYSAWCRGTNALDLARLFPQNHLGKLTCRIHSALHWGLQFSVALGQEKYHSQMKSNAYRSGQQIQYCFKTGEQ